VVYHIRLEGINPLTWTLVSDDEFPKTGPIRVAPENARRRRGVLALPDPGFTVNNLTAFTVWLVEWIK
jgi:hypothetical protein